MFHPDFIEWLSILLMAPVALLAVGFRFVTALYVYIDVEQRTKSRLFSLGLAAAVTLCYWPISFLAYLACTAILDRRRTSQPTV